MFVSKHNDDIVGLHLTNLLGIIVRKHTYAKTMIRLNCNCRLSKAQGREYYEEKINHFIDVFRYALYRAADGTNGFGSK